jgi:Restriction endonuclease
MDLNQALAEFDATETNLKRLETVWERMSALIPDGISFLGESVEGIEHEDLRRSFRELTAGLPMIAGFGINDAPLALDEIAQNRFDALEIGILEASISVEDEVRAPGEAIREYRFRFNRVRRQIVRERTQQLIGEVGTHLSSLQERIEPDATPIDDPEWIELVDAVREVERLAGSSTARTGRWRELARHLAWGQGIDLRDIAEHDWPSILVDVQSGLYAETEPLPVHVKDLAELVELHPTGAVSVSLSWNALDDEGFERLIFNIITDTPGYDNAQWLTKTRAPDKGLDISAWRVYEDELRGPRRHRVIIQCKHWLTKSVGPKDVNDQLALIPLCEPPYVDVLVVATSGRFTRNAVEFIEKHNDARKRPEIDMWPESHLESLLAQRPHLVPPPLRNDQ